MRSWLPHVTSSTVYIFAEQTRFSLVSALKNLPLKNILKEHKKGNIYKVPLVKNVQLN